jgi:transposase-like protein
MNTLAHKKRCAVVRCFDDGCSIRATTRMTGIAKNTVQKATRELGEAAVSDKTGLFRYNSG